ncbi:MAG: response regulator transcription factor [Campylobacterota bacterium]|nr:response regulator transcription factor [Campylobacterota bacterium]
MKILLLEDEVMLNESIVEYLSAMGHSIFSYYDGDSALKAASKKIFDLLILDINVPGTDGFSLLENLHENKIQTPAIYISALVDIEDISRAFDLGCYDYLKKPFHLRELSIRIEKLMNTHSETNVHIKLSRHYSFDSQSSTLLFDNIPQILTKRQSQMISLLAKNRGRVVDFELFRSYVWDEAIIDNATIRAEVNRLKKVLKEEIIQNIRSMGYMIDIPHYI